MKPEPFRLEAIFEQYEHQPDMLVIGASDASSPTLRELAELVGNTFHFDDVRLSYGDVRGDLRLREAIAHSYGDAIDAERVLVTIGGSEAILIAASTLLAPGDVALVPKPAYQPLATLPSAVGATVETYEYTLHSEFGYELDVEALLNRIAQKPPTLLVINTPHNPTGHVIDESQMRTLLVSCRTHGVRVLVDEVFNGAWLNDTAPVPSAITLDDSVMVVGSFSKVYGLSGVRVGWLAGSKADITAARGIRHYTTIAPPLLVQTIAALAVEHRDAVFGRTQDIVHRNQSVVLAWLHEHRDSFEWNQPHGGLVMLLRLRLSLSADELCHDLAKRHNVFIVPCDTTFGMERVLRLGLGTAPRVLKEGLSRFTTYLQSR